MTVGDPTKVIRARLTRNSPTAASQMNDPAMTTAMVASRIDRARPCRADATSARSPGRACADRQGSSAGEVNFVPIQPLNITC